MLRTPPQNMTIIDEENGNEKRKNSKTAGDSVLRSSQNRRKVLRSPIISAPQPMVLADGHEKRVSAVQSQISTPTDITARVTELERLSAPTDSPRLEQITRMREIEEESLRKCVAILRSMEQAIERQKNISKDVKDGVSVLNEQFDVIKSCRRSWKELESVRNSEAAKAVRDSLARNTANLHPAYEEETPVTGRTKRAASSPVAPDTQKKIKQNRKEGGKTANMRKEIQEVGKEEQRPTPAPKTVKRAKRKRKNRDGKDGKKIPEAVLIKPTQGKSYAEVLRDLKNTVKPEEAEIAIRSVRKTKNGCILLELAEGGSKEKFCEAIKNSMKDKVNVSSLKPRTTLEIRDLDTLSEAEEVHAAIKKLVQNQNEEVHVRMTKANTREQRRAFVTLATEEAIKILNDQRIKIGWTYCRVKRVPSVQRCFKCFGTGHIQGSCRGPDRKAQGLCIKCGIAGHFKKDCTNAPRCCICMAEGKIAVDHIPGTTGCPAYTRPNRS